MKRKIYFLVSIIGLALIVVAFIRFVSSRGPKEGELRVDSYPTASVFLDNANIGNTPYRDKVISGEHELKLVPGTTSSRLVSWQGKVKIGQNLLTYVNATLSESELTTAVDVVWLEKITSKLSELSVTTAPDGATVSIDEVTKGVTPLTIQDISQGEHTVKISSPGFQTRSLTIRTTAGYRLIASLKLALSSGGATAEASPSALPAKTPILTQSSTQSASQLPDPKKPFVIIKETPTGFLRVREDASTTASESGRVNPGEKYRILDSKNGWYNISLGDNKTGWISGQYAQEIE